MNAQHTPGPWRAFQGEVDIVPFVASLHGSKESICECYSQHDGSHHANARLIASAPELLEALERLVHPMASDDDMDHAREVIAKARGQA